MPFVQVFSAENLALQFLEGAVVDMLDNPGDVRLGVFERPLGDTGIGPEVQDIGFSLKPRGRVDDDMDALELGPAADNLAELFPVDVGHDQVGKNDVRLYLLEHLQGRKPVLGGDHHVVLLFQEFHQQL